MMASQSQHGPPAEDEKAVDSDSVVPPNGAVEAVPRRKDYPPETVEAVRTRRWVIFSFWAIALFLGLPIWWKTTTVYRAKLPLDQMMDWADGRACRPVFPLRISIEAHAMQEQEAQHLLRTTQHALDDLNDFSAHHLRLQLSPPPNATTQDEEVALTVRLTPAEATDAVLDPYEPILDIHYTPNQIPAPSSSSSLLSNYIANNLRSVFAEEQAMIAYLLSTSSNPPDTPKSLQPSVAEDLAKRSTRAVKYAPTYHLTFSLFTPTSYPSTWEISSAISQHLKPLLRSLAPISNFTIDTQVQLYATPGISTSPLRQSDLSSFINAAEWPLSPSIGGAPTINFILYVSPDTPLSIENSTSNSWLIPQWGSVVLAPNATTLRPAMLQFSSHLLSLLGAPSSHTLTLPLRLSTLSRVRPASLLLDASSTLGSLARLSVQLPGISIPDRVLLGVQKSIHHLEKACKTLGTKEGLENARIAEREAEKAFFEKSMVGQVYFPDEHKVAVYLPLLGPVCVPLFLAVFKEVRSVVRGRGKLGGS